MHVCTLNIFSLPYEHAELSLPMHPDCIYVAVYTVSTFLLLSMLATYCYCCFIVQRTAGVIIKLICQAMEHNDMLLLAFTVNVAQNT